MPNTAISSRDFYLIVKEKDNKGNLKIDYKINKIKIQEEEKTTYGALAKKMAEHLQKQKMSAQSNWRSCRTQSNTYYYSMPPSYWNKRNNDWICQRDLAKRIFIGIRIQKIEWGSGSNFSSYRKNSIYSISPFL